MATPLDFSKALLSRLGLTRTNNRLVSLVAFVGIEQGNWASNLRGSKNPFNTTLRMPGSRSITGVGVQAYPNWSTGIEATAKTLAQSNMRLILDALKRDATPAQFLAALSQSSWCTTRDAQGNITHYCDYTVFNPTALYNAWANKEDSGEALDAGIDWRSVMVYGSIAAFAGGAYYWYKTKGGTRRFRLV